MSHKGNDQFNEAVHEATQEKYEIENEEIKKLLKGIGGAINDSLPKGWGFTLLLFNNGDGGAMFYLSSATRPTMIEAMKEFITKQEQENNGK